MYKFISRNRDKRKLHKSYIALFKHNLDQKWGKFVANQPLLKKVLPQGMTPTKLFVAEFRKLVDVYFSYIDYLNSLSVENKEIVNTTVKKFFNYDSHASKIAKFLHDEYEIHNCVYCDSSKVSIFHHKRKEVRRFDIDHVLDKGRCPLTSLSLYNLVPSCKICNNSPLKGRKTIGDTIEEIKHLSPTNPSYDFWHHVKFVINPKFPNISNTPRAMYENEYELDIEYYKDTTYAKSVNLFELKDRYNTDFLHEALRYLDLKDKYTNRQILDMAKIFGKTYDEVYEDIFKIKFDQTHHSLYRKAKEDILGITTFG